MSKPSCCVTLIPYLQQRFLLCILISIDINPASVYNRVMNDVYSVNEAAEKLNLDPSQIRRLLAKGEIKGKKLGRDWVVLDLNYTRKRKPKGGKK